MIDMGRFLLARVAEDKQIARMAAVDEAATRPGNPPWQWWTVRSANYYGHDSGPRGSVECSPAHALADCDVRERIIIRCQEEMLSGIPRLVHFAKQTLWEMSAPYNQHPDFPEATASILVDYRPLAEPEIRYGQWVWEQMQADGRA